MFQVDRVAVLCWLRRKEQPQETSYIHHDLCAAELRVAIQPVHKHDWRLRSAAHVNQRHQEATLDDATAGM